MLDAIPFLPKILPMSTLDFESTLWKGALSHIGPVADLTPLQVALLKKTNCSLYMIYLGCVGLCHQRTASMFDQKLNLLLMEQIFAYQFDYRYVKTFGITIEDVDDTSDKIRAIRRSIAYFFFEILERAPSYFVSGRPVADVSFIINLTRFICGPVNRPTVDNWVRGIIGRMDVIAASTVIHSPYVDDFPDRLSWELAASETHGAPLPLEVLDLSLEMAGIDFSARAASQLATIDPSQNQLFVPVDELVAAGFVGTPYRIGG